MTSVAALLARVPVGRSGPTPLLAFLVLLVLPLVAGSFQVALFGQLLLFAALAIALDVVWGYGGVLSLAHGALFALGAYAMALTATRWDAAEAHLAGLAIGIALAAAAAVLLGWFLFGGNVTGPYLAILTLAVALLLEQVALDWAALTGGFNGVYGIPPITRNGTMLFYIAAAALLVVYVVSRAIVESPFGRILVAIRDNEQRAEFFAYDVAAYKVAAFGISGAMAGLAGALYAQHVGFVSPSLFGFVLAAEIAIWVLIGGRGTLIGAALGAIAVRWVQSYFGPSLLEYWLAVLGIVFMLVVVLLPQGVYPLLDRTVCALWPRRAWPGRWRSAAAAELPRVAAAASADGAAPAAPALETHGLVRSFKTLRAVDGLNLSVPQGTLRCLVGPNGAGKTTLLNLVTGALAPDAGSVRIYGRDVTALKPHRIAALGVARKFQVPNVFPHMTVHENLLVAVEGAGNHWLAMLLGRVCAACDGEAVALLRSSGLTQRLGTLASELSHGEKQWLELCMALAPGPRLLLLDEPTAGLTVDETGETARVVRELARRRGLTVVVIEHDMSFVRAVADTVTVLHRGRVLAEGSLDDVRADQSVQDVYLGTPA